MLLNSEHVRRDVDTLRLRRSSVTWRRTRWRRYMNQPPPPPTTKQPPNISRQAGTIHPDHSGKNIAFSSFSLFSLWKNLLWQAGPIREGQSFCPIWPWPRKKTDCPTPLTRYSVSETRGTSEMQAHLKILFVFFNKIGFVFWSCQQWSKTRKMHKFWIIRPFSFKPKLMTLWRAPEQYSCQHCACIGIRKWWLWISFQQQFYWSGAVYKHKIQNLRHWWVCSWTK